MSLKGSSATPHSMTFFSSLLPPEVVSKHLKPWSPFCKILLRSTKPKRETMSLVEAELGTQNLIGLLPFHSLKVGQPLETPGKAP